MKLANVIDKIFSVMLKVASNKGAQTSKMRIGALFSTAGHPCKDLKINSSELLTFVSLLSEA